MKNFDLNDTLKLSFSVRRNIILLREKKIPFLIVRDTVTKMKYIKFKTKLFDSNEILVVKIPYNLIAKLFGFKDINLITLEEDKFNYYSDNSFDRIQQIIQRKYGNPAYCDGTDQHLIFNIGELRLIHSIYEFRMGVYRHQVQISKDKNRFFKPTNYNVFVEMKLFVLEYLPKNMKLTFFYFDNRNLSFIFENETEGFQCRQNNKSLELISFEIIRTKEQEGRTLISHKPISKNSIKLEASSFEDSKVVIKEYFSRINII